MRYVLGMREGMDEKQRRFRQIKEELPTLSTHIDAAEHRRLTLIRELDELDLSLGEGLTTARWLAWRIGLSPGVAREKVRVARALGKLPRIDAAFGRGELSYSKVRAVTRVATPETEEAILHQARIATAAQLEKICRGVRRVQRQREAKGKSREGDRWVLWRETDDGMVVVKAKMEPDEAAALVKAIETAQQRAFDRERAEARARAEAARGVSAATPAGDSAPGTGDVSAATPAGCSTSGAGDVSAATPTGRPRWPGRVDALLEIAEAYVASGAPPACRTAAERRQIVIALTPSALIDKAHQVTLDDGTRVSAEAFRRLACDAGLLPAVVNANGRPLDVGRKTRSIPTPIMRALGLRDGGSCQFPGCLNKLCLEGHHRDSWLDGGETKLDNLLLLCELCGARHKSHYADSRIMPRSRWASTICVEFRELSEEWSLRCAA